ncbi:MAG: DUF3035 domain-containing protein [Emcibacteraceae bacterium]|nr:DUF3035 domain-containing protein [Emcibacteraceae bacterium]MDG1858532.1 DUF3035 domain-containing protein [Emcibacteraceae bacterium]
MNNKLTLMVSVIALATVLTGCGGKNIPDEFLVLKNAPLSMPPDFHMTPGGPTNDIDEAIEPQVIAQRALFGDAN